MVEVGPGEFQLSWGLSQVQEVPAVQEEKSRDAAVVFGEQEEEEPSGEAQEEEATLLTENPDAAAVTLSDVVTQSLENAYGKQLQNLPENNVSEGIPAEQQIPWEENCDSEEKDKRAEDYEQIQEANQERLAVDTSSAPVLYEEVYPGVDLEYTVQGQKLKENIIMKSPEAQNRFSFQMETDGMEIREEGNSLLFVDGDRETIGPDPDSRGRMAAGRNPCVSGHTGSGDRDLPVGESDPGYLCALQYTEKELLY